MDNQAFTLLMNKFQEQDDKFNSIDEKLDDLLMWKYKLTGIIVTVSAIVGIVVQIVINKLS
jgi:hypothetical protein